jgi:hypothetical protein
VVVVAVLAVVEDAPFFFAAAPLPLETAVGSKHGDPVKGRDNNPLDPW